MPNWLNCREFHMARSLQRQNKQAAPLVTPPSARVAASLISSIARRAPLAPGCCPIWGLRSRALAGSRMRRSAAQTRHHRRDLAREVRELRGVAVAKRMIGAAQLEHAA